jgi:hypothetical protein
MIESASALVLKSAGSLLAKKFGSTVISRWTDYRKKRFFEAFLSEFQSSEPDEACIEKKLNEVLEDERLSSLLHDSYIKVCLSKSKTIGPKIIGYLTAELVASGEIADEEQESIFAAAEHLSDDEFHSFFSYYNRLRAEAEDTEIKKKKTIKGASGIIRILDERWIETGTQSGRDSDLTPESLWVSLGAWASKLENFGLIRNSMTVQSHYIREDSERHIDYDQTWDEYLSKAIFESTCDLLWAYIERAIPTQN